MFIINFFNIIHLKTGAIIYKMAVEQLKKIFITSL